ncbi:MAG: MBL fold metallo-hydrolase [Blastochloris sp.]|nr:MBL fold metallo-hydrolase [Blastochloris sp.]
MSPQLEDGWLDVLGKARRGLGLSEEALAQASGLPLDQLRSILAGQSDPSCAPALASALGLQASALRQLMENAPRPFPSTPQDLTIFSTPFDDMLVNSYLLCDYKNSSAIAFDTGADAGPMLDHIKAHQLTLKLILLTHTHGDHILDLDRLMEKTRATAWVHEREALPGAEPFRSGHLFELDSWQIETRLTWGHSRGGCTYVVRGASQALAVVGDALFASSMGGGRESYPDALATNQKEIFSLPDETLLCPGHGPLSTVGLEKIHNPFYRP